MDIVITPRGKIVPQYDEFPIESNNEVLLAMYFRTALIDALHSSDLNYIGRTVQTRDPDQKFILEQNIKETVMNGITSSDFSSDFDISQLNIDIQFDEDDSFTVEGTYGKTTATAGIVHSVTIEAGTMVLNDEDTESYSFNDIIPKLMSEEIVIKEPTTYIELSNEGIGLIAVAEYGAEIHEVSYIGDTSTIPNENRYSHKHVSFIDNRVEFVGWHPDENSNTIESSIFVKSIIKELKSNSSIMTIKDNSGNVTSFDYMEEVDDYLIRMDTSNYNIDIDVSYINVIAKGTNTSTGENTEGDLTKYPFPNDHVRGARIANLNRVLEPGVYVVIYNAIVKPEYDASLLKRY